MSDPAPMTDTDIAALVERFDDAAQDYGWKFFEASAALCNEAEAEYETAKVALAAALAAQQAEIERWAAVANREDETRRHWQARADAAESALAARDETIRGLTEALTPSGETKGAYIGEFHFDVADRDEDGEECSRRVAVPWPTIKEIMAAIRARAALKPTEPSLDSPPMMDIATLHELPRAYRGAVIALERLAEESERAARIAREKLEAYEAKLEDDSHD